jgi:hypothetical protein
MAIFEVRSLCAWRFEGPLSARRRNLLPRQCAMLTLAGLTTYKPQLAPR